MDPGRRIWRPLATFKFSPKAFHEGLQVTATPTDTKKCVSEPGKVFPARNGEYLGSIGPLWWHMVEVGILRLRGFGRAWGSLGSPNGSQAPYLVPFGDFGILSKGISRRSPGHSHVNEHQKCASGPGKVFSGRNGEYFGSIGPLWWHMVKSKFREC